MSMRIALIIFTFEQLRSDLSRAVIVQVPSDINLPSEARREEIEITFSALMGDGEIGYRNESHAIEMANAARAKSDNSERSTDYSSLMRLLLLHNIAIGHLDTPNRTFNKAHTSGFSSTFISSLIPMSGFILLIECCCLLAHFFAQKEKRN